MLSYIKWAFWIVFWTVIAAFFHYTLPQYDVVRIVSSETKRVDFGANSIFWSNPGSGEASGTVNRDVFFIHTIKPNGQPSVYRNEDTGWGWPPYFKFDTTNLQASASDLVSNSSAPIWVAVRHYGWRIEYISIFPNALRIMRVDGPDARVIPWTSVVVLLVFGCFVWAIWARLRRFRRNRIDPLLDDVEEGYDRATGWLGSWRGPSGRP